MNYRNPALPGAVPGIIPKPGRMPAVEIATDEDRERSWSPSTQMAIALGGKPLYEGTVGPVERAARRARNRRARAARRLHRKAARR